MDKNKENYQKPVFFLITCVKNGRNFINKLFDSLLEQTKINFVHYIYEDGSDDPITDLIDEYKKRVSKLKCPYEVIYECNKINIGLNNATMHCIQKCFLPYFIWIDCDNWVDKNFFKELETTIVKNNNPILVKTEINKQSVCDNKENPMFSTKYSKNQLGVLLRRRFFYSFFAVNFSYFKKINPNFKILNERNFYNDEQILISVLIHEPRISFSKKAIGYYLYRENSEGNSYTLSLSQTIFYQAKLLFSISKEDCHKLLSMYKIYFAYKKLDNSALLSKQEFNYLVKMIKKESKENNISLSNFYKPNLFIRKIKYSLRNML